MRILHVLAQLPALTGSGSYFSNLCCQLQRYQHQQAALYAVQGDLPLPALPETLRRYPLPFQTPELPFAMPGMSDLMPYPASRYGELSAAQLTAWRQAFAARLLRAQREFEPDLLILHHLWLLTALAVELFQTTRKMAVCHQTDLRQMTNNPGLWRQYGTSLAGLEAVFCLSEAQKLEIRRRLAIPAEKLITLGGGYDQALFYPAAAKQRGPGVQICYAGKLAAAKGIFALLAAFRQARRQRPELPLCLNLVGRPEVGQAEELAAHLAGAADIQLFPPCPQAELAAFLRSQDIFVLPSFYEGLGLLAVESLASGLWTVTTEIEGLMALLGEQVRQSGAIVYLPLPRLQQLDQPLAADLPAFVDRLTAAILQQSDKVAANQPFPAAALTAVRQYSWAAITAKVQAEISRPDVV